MPSVKNKPSVWKKIEICVQKSLDKTGGHGEPMEWKSMGTGEVFYGIEKRWVNKTCTLKGKRYYLAGGGQWRVTWRSIGIKLPNGKIKIILDEEME